MSIPRSILFPVDFSDRCRATWPSVAGIARAFSAPVTLLHALELRYLATAELSLELEAIRRQIRENLQQFPTPGLEPDRIRREMAEGTAADCIVERAAEMEAPLIMMPTRGHTRFRQLLLGSVTAGVLHDATCPVWTGAHSEAGADSDGGYRSIVCAVDLGPSTPGVLSAAAEFSAHLGASLQAVHSVPAIDPDFPSATASRAHAFLLDNAHAVFPKFCRMVGKDLALEISEESNVVDGILAAAARHNADLLIIGRGVIQGPLGRLRTNAHEIIRRSRCPVLSV